MIHIVMLHIAAVEENMTSLMDPAMDKLHTSERKDTGKFSAAEWLLLATAGLAFSAVVGMVGYSALIV